MNQERVLDCEGRGLLEKSKKPSISVQFRQIEDP